MKIYRIAAPAHLYFDVRAASEEEAIAKADAVVTAMDHWDSVDEFVVTVPLDTERFPNQTFHLDAVVYGAPGEITVEDEREDEGEEE
jgi:hypothetical protein